MGLARWEGAPLADRHGTSVSVYPAGDAVGSSGAPRTAPMPPNTRHPARTPRRRQRSRASTPAPWPPAGGPRPGARAAVCQTCPSRRPGGAAGRPWWASCQEPRRRVGASWKATCSSRSTAAMLQRSQAAAWVRFVPPPQTSADWAAAHCWRATCWGEVSRRQLHVLPPEGVSPSPTGRMVSLRSCGSPSSKNGRGFFFVRDACMHASAPCVFHQYSTKMRACVSAFAPFLCVRVYFWKACARYE